MTFSFRNDAHQHTPFGAPMYHPDPRLFPNPDDSDERDSLMCADIRRENRDRGAMGLPCDATGQDLLALDEYLESVVQPRCDRPRKRLSLLTAPVWLIGRW